MTGTYQGNPYIPAAHHGGVRTGTQFIVVHTTENTQGQTTATDIANFFAHEVNPTSAHGVADDKSLVRCLTDDTIAYHCGTHGNAKGLGLEHIGKAAMTASEWNTPYTNQMLIQSARQIAYWCRKYGIPPLKISAQDLLLGHRGICGHLDVTAAWPQDTTHSDPGRYWPWAKHIGLIRAMLASPAPQKGPPMAVMYLRASGPAAGHAVLIESGKQVQLGAVHANLYSTDGIPYASTADASQDVIYDKAYGPVTT